MSYRDLRRAMKLLTQPTRGDDTPPDFRKLSAEARRACRRWLSDANVIGYGIGRRVTAGRETSDLALRVHVLKKLPRSRVGTNYIPPAVRLPGVTRPLLIDVIESDIGRGQLALAGDGISLAGSTEFGTIGCVVRRSGSADLFAVSCRHVLEGNKGDPVEWAEFPPAPQLPNPGIGALTAFKSPFKPGAGFPNTTDITLVRLQPGAVSPVVRWLGRIAGVRTTPLVDGEAVRLCGFGTSLDAAGSRGDCSGRVLEPQSNQLIELGHHGELGFRDVVLCNGFTKGMDSGAAVLDSENRLVGIHMAGTPPGARSSWSVFQPIGSVFGEFGLSLATEAGPAPLSAPEAHAAGATEGRAPPSVGSTASAIDILARTLWGEGRGEPLEGRRAIANVVLNRVAKDKPGRFGATVEGVCQKKDQFSCWNLNDVNRAKLLAVTAADNVFRECLDIARAAVNGSLSDNTVGSDHYHASSITASWAKGRTPVVVIGRHLFYNNIP